MKNILKDETIRVDGTYADRICSLGTPTFDFSKVKAYRALGNTYCLVIYDIVYDVDDYVVVGWSNETRKTKNRIRYNRIGQPYFIKSGLRYYLNEFMRVVD